MLTNREPAKKIGDTPPGVHNSRATLSQDRCMALPGKRQRGKEPAYDPTSGGPYRAGLYMDPVTGAKLVRLSETLNMSVSGVVRLLVERVDVDEHGRPVWADELEHAEGRLPLDSEADAA